MEHAVAELPLAIFTTLTPIGAGGFFALALAFLTTKFTPDQLKKLDKIAFIPLVVAVVGLAASFLHLADPLHALHVFEHVGSSPLSNEIVAALVFMVVALVYCIIAITGILSYGARRAFAAIVGLVALVFAVFTGMAYAVSTIPPWDSPLTPIEIVGYFLFGGALLGCLLVKLSGGYRETRQTAFRTVMIFILLAGFVMAFVGEIGRFVMVSGMTNAIVNGAALTSSLLIYLVASILLLLAALIMGIIALRRRGSTSLFVGALTIAAIATFIGRMLFYAMQVSVGIQVVL